MQKSQLITYLLSFSVLLAFAGCSLTRNIQTLDPALGVRISLDKQLYLPGEPVKCHIEIVNPSNKDIRLPYPIAAQLERDSTVVFEENSAMGIARKSPVHPTTSQEATPEVVLPGKPMTRDFLFVNLTDIEGTHALIAQYDPSRACDSAQVFSNTAVYRVEGKRLWKRTPAGLIVQEDAVAIASHADGREAQSVQADLLQTTMGLYSWRITITPRNMTSEAWLVSPYTGKVQETTRMDSDSKNTFKEDEKSSASPIELPPNMTIVRP